MSNENFRRELNAAFEHISGSPSPALRDRVRSSLSQPAERGGTYRIAAVAAVVIAAVLVGVLVMANPLHRRPVTSGPGPQVTSSPSPAQNVTPSPSPSPTANASPFVCTSTATTIAGPSGQPAVDALRTGTHAGYDRLTIEFANGRPSVEVQAQSGTTFTKSPSGQTVTVLGDKGILITLRGTDMHTSYSGSGDIKTGYATMVEVRQVQDFEGTVQLAIGVKGSGCYRVSVLTAPDRVVIDIQAG